MLQRLLGFVVLARVERADEPLLVEVEDDRAAVEERAAGEAVVVPAGQDGVRPCFRLVSADLMASLALVRAATTNCDGSVGCSARSG